MIIVLELELCMSILAYCSAQGISSFLRQVNMSVFPRKVGRFNLGIRERERGRQ